MALVPLSTQPRNRVWSQVDDCSSSSGKRRPFGRSGAASTSVTEEMLGLRPAPVPAVTSTPHSWRPSSADRPYMRAPCAKTASPGAGVTPCRAAVSADGRPEGGAGAVKLAHTTVPVAGSSASMRLMGTGTARVESMKVAVR